MNLSKINVSESLAELAKIFHDAGASLYVVGGYVRDSLLGNAPYDVDICSEVKVEDIKKLLKKTEFGYKTKNSAFGTATILCGDEVYEYTCFRKETYALDGSHVPLQVEFVNDIKIDAKRRDFYINALYYDIYSQQVLDPLGKALADLRNRTLRVIEHEVCAFKEDAARILRLIKFGALLDFKIEPQTLQLAKQHSILLNNITQARFKKELGFISGLEQHKKDKVNQLFALISPNFDQLNKNILKKQ